MRDFVDPGSNSTLSKVLDFLSPMVSTTMMLIVIGVRLLSLGFPVLGVGIMKVTSCSSLYIICDYISWSESESRDMDSHSVSSVNDALSAVMSESVVHTVLTSKRAFCSLFESTELPILKLIGNSIEMFELA